MVYQPMKIIRVSRFPLPQMISSKTVHRYSSRWGGTLEDPCHAKICLKTASRDRSKAKISSRGYFSLDSVCNIRSELAVKSRVVNKQL